MEKTYTIEEAQVIYTTGSTLRGVGNQKMVYALERNLEAIRKAIKESRVASEIDASLPAKSLKEAEDKLIKAAQELSEDMPEDKKDAWFAEESKKLKPFRDRFNDLDSNWRKGTVTFPVYTLKEKDIREVELSEIDGAPRDPKHTDAQFLNQYRARYNWILTMLDCVVFE